MYLWNTALLVVLAHPLAGQAGTFAGVNLYGHALRVQLTPGALELEYVLEAPLVQLSKEAAIVGDSGFAEHKLAELSDGLRLTLDGAPLPWEPVPVERPTKPGEAGLVELTLHRRATLPPSGTLRVSNGNQPDENALFAADILVDGEIVVTRSSLVEVRDGKLVKNHHAAWLSDESARELEISFRPARFYERADAPAPMPLRLEGLVPGPPWALLGAGLLTVSTITFFWRRRRITARPESS